MVFPVHSSILGLVFCFVNENSLNCTSGLVLLCFSLFLSGFISCDISRFMSLDVLFHLSFRANTTCHEAMPFLRGDTKISTLMFHLDFFLQIRNEFPLKSFIRRLGYKIDFRFKWQKIVNVTSNIGY